MAAFPNDLKLPEKIRLFFFRDGSSSLARIVVGGALGVLIGSGAGALTLGLVGLGLVGLTALSQIGIEASKKQILTDFYRDEIAASLGKSPEQVTTQDLEPMMKTPDEGGHGSYAIKAAVKNYARVRNYHVAFQAVTAGLMTAGLALLTGIFPGISTVALAGISSLLYDELYDNVRTGGEVFLNVNKGTVTRDIRAISDQISLGGRISSTRVFHVFVKTDPQLANAIRERYGMEYEALNITAKREVVRDYSQQYPIYQITQDINYGHINPTELGFLAYGQKSGVPRREQALSPFKGLENEGRELCAEENGRIVCRGNSEAAMVPDNAYNALPLHQRVSGMHEASPLTPPDTQPERVYDPRELFHSEQVRESRLKDPFKTLQ